MDHSEGFSVLERSIVLHGVKIFILHDYRMFYNSSCVQENARLRTLAEIAHSYNRSHCLEFRVLKPSDRERSCQHSKTWIVDGVYYVSGSSNFTGASEGNFEEVIFLKNEAVLADAQTAFWSAWNQGTPISLEELRTLEVKTRRSWPAQGAGASSSRVS